MAFKTCQHCMRAREWLQLVCGGWMYQGVAEELEDHYSEAGYESWWLRKAIAGMKYEWETESGKRWRLLPVPKPELLNVPGLVTTAAAPPAS